MSELNSQYEICAKAMLDENIVKFGEFNLKSGKKSVAYVNLRELISLPHLFAQVTDAYADTLTRSGLLVKAGGEIRHLAAIPEAAMYYCGAVGRAIQAPLLQHRVKPKEHGQPRPIEGRYSEGDECVLLDDVITTAASKIDEAAAFSEMGIKVTGVVVLVDREQGGRSELESQGIEFSAAMTLSGIAKYALDERLAGVTQTLYDQLLSELSPVEVNRA